MAKVTEPVEKITEQDYFPNFVAEESEQYHVLIPYTNRSDLTSAEKTAIGNYQDLHPWNTQKGDWSFEIPENWREKACCYVINSCCRFPKFYDSMSEDEKGWIDELFGFLDSAIEKSRLPGKRTAYRCVKNADWLPEDHEIGTEYVDPAYGSFSLSLENALRYSNENNIIIFQLPITEEMKALYIDEEEYEILRPRNCQYRIRNIYKIKIMIFGKLKIATIYRIEEMEGKIDARRNDE